MVPDILKMGIRTPSVGVYKFRLWKGRVNIYQKRLFLLWILLSWGSSKCTVPLKKPQIKLLLFGERQTSQDNFLFNHQMSTYISCKTLHIILGHKSPPPPSYSALFQNFRRQLCRRRIRRSVHHKSKVAPNEVAKPWEVAVSFRLSQSATKLTMHSALCTSHCALCPSYLLDNHGEMNNFNAKTSLNLHFKVVLRSLGPFPKCAMKTRDAVHVKSSDRTIRGFSDRCGERRGRAALGCAGGECQDRWSIRP